jgi:hypothetical protein
MDALAATYAVPANSDYFPFVDLTAPRMRFLGRDALAVSLLNSLPVPVVRLLGSGSDAPVSYGTQQSRTSLDHERRTDEALALARAIQTGEVADVAPSAAADVVLLRSMRAECAAAEPRGVWFDALTRVSEQTSPFLDSAGNAALWDWIGASSCAHEADANERRWIEYLRAMASGARAEVATQGLAWFESPDAAMSPQQLTTVLLGTSAALVGEQRQPEAAQLLRLYVPAMAETGRYELAFRLLVGMAQSGMSHTGVSQKPAR